MNIKPHILLITPLPPPVHGSSMVSKQIKDSKLLNDEFDMDFVNLSTSRKVEEIQKGGLWLITKKTGRFLLAFLRVFLSLYTNHYDLCYLAITCHGKPFLKDFPFVMLCKMFQKKIIIHQHNKGMSEDITTWPYNWAIPMAYKETKVILLSTYLYNDVSKVVHNDQVLICPNGIPYETCCKIKKEDKIPHFLFLSNLIKSKGVFVLLEACRIMKDKKLDFVCDFVGRESKDICTAQFHQKVQDLDIANYVIYHGSKYDQDKEQYWQQADVFVFPTFYKDECFPLVILEAMQHALPVVTTNEGGIPDIVIDGETGFICEHNNAQQLADKIELLLNDKQLCKTMGQAGRKRYEENFTMDIFEKKFAECIQNALTS